MPEVRRTLIRTSQAILIGLGLLSPVPAWALDDDLGLSAALAAAATDSLPVRQAQAQLETLRQKEAEAFGSLLPSLSLSGNYGQQWPSSTGNPLAPVSAGDINQLAGGTAVPFLQTGLQASVTVFDGLRGVMGYRTAQLQSDQAVLRVRQVRAEAVLAAADAYFALVRSQANRDLASQAVILAHAHVDQAARYLEAGIGIAVDLLRAKASLLLAEQDQDAAGVECRKAEMALNLSMGRVPEAAVRIRREASLPDPAVSASEAVATARLGRPELQIQRSRLEVDGIGVDSATRIYWPAVGLGVSSQLHDSSWIGGRFFNQGNMTVGANLNWTLFDGLQAVARLRQAEQQRSADECALLQLERMVEQEVQQALLDTGLADRRQARARQAAKVATEALDLARWRYQEHVATSWEVREAQSGWQQAQQALIAADMAIQTARARLYLAMGKLSADLAR